jgi:hypothetical protein
MLRRLFFLMPDEPHAQRLVDALIDRGIARRRMHAIAHDVDLKNLPEATERQKKDSLFRVERFFWEANLALFATALVVLLAAIAAGDTPLGLACIAIMIVSFIAGEQFAVRVPDVHLSEFTDALNHGEILLMIDVPVGRVEEVENYVHHNHPEAAVGGVSWSTEAFGL